MAKTIVTRKFPSNFTELASKWAVYLEFRTRFAAWGRATLLIFMVVGGLFEGSLLIHQVLFLCTQKRKKMPSSSQACSQYISTQIFTKTKQAFVGAPWVHSVIFVSFDLDEKRGFWLYKGSIQPLKMPSPNIKPVYLCEADHGIVVVESSCSCCQKVVDVSVNKRQSFTR